MIISVLMPGLLIYIIYSLMGTITSSVMGTDNEDASYTACVVNMPESLSEGFERLELVDGLSEDEAKKKIADGELDLYMVFPENFLEDITAGKNDPYPNVKVYYDSSAQSSVKAFTYVNTVFEILQGIKFTVNLPVEGENIRFDCLCLCPCLCLRCWCLAASPSRRKRLRAKRRGVLWQQC